MVRLTPPRLPELDADDRRLLLGALLVTLAAVWAVIVLGVLVRVFVIVSGV